MEINLPKGSNQISVFDVNMGFFINNIDGSNDIVIPICYPLLNCKERNEILILYNSQMKLCTSIFGGSDCRSQNDLCTSSKFNFHFNNTIKINSLFFFHNDKNYIIPPSIRFGDFNQDGYVGILNYLLRYNFDFKKYIKYNKYRNI
jgi:hypothetical protein